MFKIQRQGFTLAEILITLGILGVVAALTMPTLFGTVREKQTVAKLRKIYSSFGQALKMAEKDYGSIDGWAVATTGTANKSKQSLEILSKYMKLENCDDSACFSNTTYKSLTGTNGVNIEKDASMARSATAGGYSFYISYWGACEKRGDTPTLENVCASLTVDVNGKTPPNQYGIDTFSFNITQQGIMPQGTKDELYGNGSMDKGCNKDKPGQHNGKGCTAWVIQNGNMDYIRKKVQW